MLGLSWSGLACLRIISSPLEEVDDWRGIYEEDWDHLPQAQDTVVGMIKETQTSLKSLGSLLNSQQVEESLPGRLLEQLCGQGCFDLLREHLKMLENLLKD